MSKKVIVDCRMSNDCLYYLKNIGYDIIEIPCCPILDKPVSAHPDMSLIKIHDKIIAYDNIEHLFHFFGQVIPIKREVPEGNILKYPYDIGLNCAVVGNNLVCNVKYTHEKVLNVANDNGMNIIDVKQGYAKCSTCIVSDNAIITEDIDIAKKCQCNNIDVLLLEHKAVKLNGYNCGFIGGCGACIDNQKVLFCGNIENHPEFDKIYSFCKKHSRIPVSISNEPLYDYGSIFAI